MIISYVNRKDNDKKSFSYLFPQFYSIRGHFFSLRVNCSSSKNKKIPNL